MRTINLIFIAATLCWITACSSNKLPTKLEKWTPAQTLSYAYGSVIAEQLESVPLSVAEKNPEQLAAGFIKGLEGDSAANAMVKTTLENRFNPANEVDTSDQEKALQVAYYIGVSVMGELAESVPVNAEDFNKLAFMEGVQDGINKTTPKLEATVRDSLLQAYMEPLGERYQTAMAKKAEAIAAESIAAGVAFLEKNGKRAGVVTTASGLQYEIIREGTGPKPTLQDRVKTHYHGTLVDGTVFDSSVDRGAPATFGVSQVIQGWQEGIPLMKEGAKYRLYIPQELAYGMQSPSAAIPPGSMLIFDVELLEVNPE
jgi:FKBP-type peptidyl-prolyl cis-trans isomerase